MPSTQSPLQRLAVALEAEDYPSDFYPASETVFTDLVVVYLDEVQGQALCVEIHFVQDVLDRVDWPEDAADTVSLRFQLRLPLACKPGAEKEAALFLHELNRLLALGGFGLNRTNGVLYYHYILAMPDRQPRPDLILNVILSIHSAVIAFLPTIVKVAAGMATCEEGMAELAGNGWASENVLPPPEVDGHKG